MKKINVLLTALIITNAALQAQKTTFGIRAGIQNSSFGLKVTQGDVTIRSDGSRVGAIAGGVADIKFSSKFSVQPGLLFVYKPGSLIIIGGDVETTSIDAPIDLFYHNNGFFIGAGPNFSYGISSTFKPYDNGQEDRDFYKKIAPNNNPSLKRFEIGANAALGYQFPSGLTIAANYTRGLSNIAGKDAFGDNVTFNTKQFGLSFGYMFKTTNAKK